MTARAGMDEPDVLDRGESPQHAHWVPADRERVLLQHEVVALGERGCDLFDDRVLLRAVGYDPPDLVVVGEVEREIDEGAVVSFERLVEARRERTPDHLADVVRDVPARPEVVVVPVIDRCESQLQVGCAALPRSI